MSCLHLWNKDGTHFFDFWLACSGLGFVFIVCFLKEAVEYASPLAGYTVLFVYVFPDRIKTYFRKFRKCKTQTIKVKYKSIITQRKVLFTY